MLYVRGALYLFAAAQMLFIVIVAREQTIRHLFAILLFVSLSVGGLSALAGYGSLGRFVITYVVTVLLIGMNLAMALYLIYRRP